jgi:pimeloyl-ACP methyl ester carboxylesterase
VSDTTDAAPFATPGLPDGRYVELPGRGTTWVREVAGPEGAPTVVLLHGWTVNSALNFFACYATLAERFHVVALDHRGHGHGIRSWRKFTLEECADDVAALLDVLGVERAIPVGYSMGGPIAQLTWERHQDRVEGLVLCATATRFRSRGGDRALTGVITGLSLATRAAPSWLHERVTERLVTTRYDTSPLGCWAREQARLNDLRSMIEAGHAVGSYDARSWVGSIDVPTAVVLTSYDTTVPPERQQAMADAIPGARVFPVSGGHDVCAVDPPAFVPVLLDACTDVADRAASRDRRAG